MATQKQQGIKKRLTKGFTKVAVIGAVAAIIGIGALLIAAAQYEKALNRYGFTQGDIGKAMTAFRRVEVHCAQWSGMMMKL